MTAHVPERPLLAPWYRMAGDSARLLLEHGQRLVVLEGAAVRALVPALLPLLDGTRTVDEIVRRLGDPVRPAVDAALALLAGRGLLVEGPLTDANASAFAAAHGIEPSEAAERQRLARVGVAGSSTVALEVARTLRLGGIRQVERADPLRGGDEPWDILVVAPAPGEEPLLREWNEQALARDLVWLPVRPYDGRLAAVSPLVVPRESACLACLDLRRAAHLIYADDMPLLEAVPVRAIQDATLTQMVAAITAQLVLRWLVAHDRTLPGTVTTIELAPALVLREHRVLRVPRCPSCSPSMRTAPPLPWHEAVAS